MSIDWKDVNKELPKEDCKVVLRFEFSWAVDTEVDYGIYKFYKKDNNFINVCDRENHPYDFEKKNKFKNWGVNLDCCHTATHWAYINEPTEE